MPGSDQTTLRQTFDEAAELYDRARPGYPPALFDDLAHMACIGPGCRVLEIGCGTGKATVSLAERGCEIVCAESGANLAAVARRNLDRLRGGTLATIDTHHIAGGDEAFFVEVQHCYERWDPATSPGLRQLVAAELFPLRRPGPIGAIWTGDVPPLRAGAAVHDCRVHRRTAYVFWSRPTR